MVKEHRQSGGHSESSERDNNHTEKDHIDHLREAYLAGLIIVDSHRLAENMINFERQLDLLFSKKDRS